MEQSIEPSFFVSSVAWARIDSPHRWEVRPITASISLPYRYIIRWRLEVSFSSLRFRGEYDQLFVLPTQFSRGKKRKKKEERGYAREVAAASFLPSFFNADALHSPPADTLARSPALRRALSMEVSFGSSREACGRWLVITLEEGAEVGRGGKKTCATFDRRV